MATNIFLSVPAFVGVILLVLVWIAARAYFRFRGNRMVVCPETGKTAVVEVDARHAAWTAPLGRPELEIKSCSEWPERRECDQGCGQGIESSPADSTIRNVIANWYRHKDCVLCGKTFDHAAWLEHEPALMSPDHRLLTFDEIPVAEIPEVLATFTPVCWECRMAELMRRSHPNLFNSAIRDNKNR